MLLAVVTNTPLPDVWRFTIGQAVRYMTEMPTVMPLFNPFSGMGEGGGTETNPDKIRALAASLGIGSS